MVTLLPSAEILVWATMPSFSAYGFFSLYVWQFLWQYELENLMTWTGSTEPWSPTLLAPWLIRNRNPRWVAPGRWQQPEMGGEIGALHLDTAKKTMSLWRSQAKLPLHSVGLLQVTWQSISCSLPFPSSSQQAGLTWKHQPCQLPP